AAPASAIATVRNVATAASTAIASMSSEQAAAVVTAATPAAMPATPSAVPTAVAAASPAAVPPALAAAIPFAAAAFPRFGAATQSHHQHNAVHLKPPANKLANPRSYEEPSRGLEPQLLDSGIPFPR